MESVVEKAFWYVKFQRKCLCPHYYPSISIVRDFKKKYLEIQSLLKDPDSQSFDPALCCSLIREFMLLQEDLIKSLVSPSLREGVTQPCLIYRDQPIRYCEPED